MGLFDKVEKGLERTVNRAFAKAFRSEVAPVEIASAIRRAMDERRTVLGHGRTMVPNRFVIELAPSDFARFDEYADAITEDLVAAAQEHAETQSYQPGGPIEIAFTEGADLETGVFRITPKTSKRGESPAGMPPAHLPASPPVPAGPGSQAQAPRTHQPAPAPAVDDVHPDPTRAPEIDDPYRRPGAASAAPIDPAAAAASGLDPAAAAASGPAPAPGAAATPPSVAPPEVAPAPPPAVVAPAPPPPAPAPPPPAPVGADPLAPIRINPKDRPWLDIDGERYPLLGSLTVIGRDPSADIIIDDPGISRRHSEVRVTVDGPHLVSSIRDLASTNGTFVNGERITSTRVQDGDLLTIGRTSIVFHAGRR